MATTPNYGWVTPAPTDFVTDLPADFEIFADAVDADLAGLLGGTTGQVLTKASATDHDFAFANISAGGLTLITSGTLSGSSILFSSIPTTFKDLRLVIRNFLPNNNQADILLRFLDDSGANRHVSTLSLTETGLAFNSNDGILIDDQNNTTTQGVCVADFFDYANTTTFKFCQATSVANNHTTATNLNYRKRTIFYNQTTAVTSFRLSASGGASPSFVSGDYFLFGVN
jgi:hypothetical protein